MIKQLFKIMWHRKGRNFLLLSEIFFAFLVLFGTATLVIESLRNYYAPLGFDYTDVYEIEMYRNGDNASGLSKIEQMRLILQQQPELSSFAFSSSNTPYSYSTNNSDVNYEDISSVTHRYVVDPSYQETFDLQVAEGRWLQRGDVGSPAPVVINETLAETLFADEQAIGKRLSLYGEDSKEFQIVGVIRNFRQDGEFQNPGNALFHYFNPQDTAANLPGKILLEVKAGAGLAWQEGLLEKLNKVAVDWTLELSKVSDMRTNKAKMKLIPLIALSIVCGFLIVNVALGLFGVLWYNISKRYSEIGIRRALGASQQVIRWQMLGEVVVLATLGLALGVLLALQFPLLGVFNVEVEIYTYSIVTALLLIYLLVVLCAWYPSHQAARIEPAQALHFE